MPNFSVTVSFEALRYGLSDIAVTAELPEAFSLGGIVVERVARGIYQAQLEVTAPEADVAILAAAERVREVLALFAVSNLGFHIALSPSPTAQVVGRARRGRATKKSTSRPSLSVELRITNVVVRDEIEFEQRAATRRGTWPSWLRTALELNYLAVQTPDIASAFLTHFAALEVIIDGMLGSRTPVVKRELQAVQDDFVAELTRLLTRFGLSGASSSRIVARTLETEAEGSVERMRRALGQLGIEVSRRDAKLVIRRRGAFAHRGRREAEFERAAALTTFWVQELLRRLLERSVPEEGALPSPIP